MVIKNMGSAIKNKLKRGKHPGLLGGYIVYWLETIKIIDGSDSSNEIRHLWSGTQSQYDALDKIEDDTIYFIE